MTKAFENPEMPWVFVQLPAMDRPHWPLFREQQRKSLKHIPNVGMAITLDLGDKNDVHPRRKKPVGERLAAWALNNVYGKNNVPSGPLYNRVTAINRDSIVISFDHVGAGLKTVDGLAPIHFEIAATDKRYHKATAIILNKDKIKLRSPHVPEPVYVRYAWSPFPEPKVNLVNSANLPASPFTTE